MSEVLDYVREKDPRFKDVSDEDLALFIGSKKPDFLKDPGFKEDFQKAAATKSVNLALQGTGEVLKILNNPAVGEASEMGREQAQAQHLEAGMNVAAQTTGKVMKMVELGAMASPSTEELAAQKEENQKREALQKMGPSATLAAMRHGLAKPAGEGVGVLTTPLHELVPKITGDQLEKILGLIATSQPMAIARERAVGATPEERKTEPGMHPEKLLTPEARNLVRGVAGVEQSLADQANFFTSPLGLMTLGVGALPAPVAKLVGIGFTAQMASQLPGHSKAITTELNKPEDERDYEQIAKQATDAAGALAFTVGGALHLFEPVIRAARARAAYKQALKEAFPVAPLTTESLRSQVGTDYMTAGPLGAPTRLPEGEPPAGTAAEEPAKPEKPTQSKATLALLDLGWTAQQIAALSVKDKITAALEKRQPPAESAEPPPVIPEDEVMASTERTKIQEKESQRPGTPIEHPVVGKKFTVQKQLTPRDQPYDEEITVTGVKHGEPTRTGKSTIEVSFSDGQGVVVQTDESAGVGAKTLDEAIQVALDRRGAKEKGPSDAGTKVQEPKTGEIPTEQRKPTGTEAKGQAETGTPLGSSEDQGQAVKPAQKIDRIAALDEKGFSEAYPKGFTEEAHKLGASITTPEELAKLRAGKKQAGEEIKALQQEAKTKLKDPATAAEGQRLMEEGMRISMGKAQFFSEALEGAMGTKDATKLAQIQKNVGPDYKPPFPREDQFKAEVEANKKADADLIARNMAKVPEDATAIKLKNKEGTQAIVSRDIPSGKWRITYFTKDGEPWGHNVLDTRDQAIQSALGIYGTDSYGPPHLSRGYEVVSASKAEAVKVPETPETSKPTETLAPKSPEVAKPTGEQNANDLAAKANQLARTHKLSLKEKTNLGKLIEQARQGDTAPLQSEIERIQNEAPKQKQRSPTAINRDIKQVKANIKALRSAKRGYEKAKDKGAAARVQDKIRTAENKLSDLNQELNQLGTIEDDRVGQVMRRFRRETEEKGPDILSHINETGKLMSWSQFKEKAKQKGEEWFNKNKSLYDDIRNVKLPPHVNAAIFGGENLPDTVADTAFRENKLTDGTPSALWDEVKKAARERLGKEETIDKQADAYGAFNEATQPAEGKSEVDAQIVTKGDRWLVAGQEITVLGRTPEGDILVNGGEKFGAFEIPDNQPIWVDEILEQAPEGEPDFLPPEEQAEAPKPATPAETPKKGTGGELFAVEDIPFNLTAETDKGAAFKPKTQEAEQTDLLGGAPPKKEEPAFEKPKVQERPLTEAEQEEFLELSKKLRKNREEGGEALTTEETQRYELLTALAGQKDFGFSEPTGPEAIKGRIKAIASQLARLDENAPEGSGKKRQQYVEQRQKLHQEMRNLMDQLTEGQGELVFTSEPKETPSGYFTRKEYRVRQLSDDEVQDRWRNPSERMEVFKVAGTRPYVAETRRIDFEDPEATKLAGKGNWYAEGYGKTRDGAIGDARSRKGSGWSKVPEEALAPQPASPKVESTVPESTKKYRIGNNPTLYTLVERLAQSPIEKANDEQPVRVRNENTGKEEIVLESELKPVKERTAAEKEKGKAGKRDLDAELRALGLDPTVFKTKAEKQAAIIRENQKKQGPGTPHITQPPDPKANIEQLEESFRNIRGRNVPLSERVKAMFSLGKKIAAAKDLVTETIAGLKTTGDYLIDKWAGYNQLDDLLRAKGELSAEIEKNGWRMKHFIKTILDAVPDPKERAAIAKWVGAGGDMEKLIAGYEEAPDRFKQHYLDAMDLSDDLLVGAMNIRNYFDSRLQEAIDAGVLKDGVEDYIHRIYEKTPALEKKMIAYAQTGLLKTNPALAKKRIFDHDWEAERLGYNVVQDFLPRIAEYEAALTRAIAARKFVRKVAGFRDENGNKVAGMLANDGRPIIDIAGLGIPIDDAEGIREAALINPSYKAKAKTTTTVDPDTGEPVIEEDPLSNRQDYQPRNQYSVFRNWKWMLNDTEGNPIYAKGDLIIHPDYVRRFDKLLEPSRIRYAQSPTLRFAGRAALGGGSFVKQSLLDLSGFHQVQMAVHGAEHRVYTLPGEVPAGLKALGFEKIFQDIDLNDPVTDGLLKGGVTIGGDYRYSKEGLTGSSWTRLIPGVGEVMESYHQWLFQDFIPRLKMTMAHSAFERNMKAFETDLNSGKRSVEDVFKITADQANAAFGELNQITLERSKTMQDALRIIFLAPDFLEARGRFALQAIKKGGGDIKSLDYWKRGGPITNNEQRMALAFGALGLWGMARIMNIALDGQMHNEPENLFSVVYKGRSYGLRTVQGDILHLMTHPVQFWMSRLNPLFGRTFLEAASGRDYFGRKRSPLEQVWDMVSTVIPASLRHSQEHTIWESLLNAGGVTSRRFSDVDDAFKLAQKWKDKHNVGMKGEFIYDPNKDPLRPLKVALSNGDEGASVKAIKDLVNSKQFTLPRLDEYFDRYSSMPFAGSATNDRKFIQTLSNDQKMTVQAAAQHKKAMNRMYRQAKAKYNAAINGPKPQMTDEEIDAPTPQVQ